MRRANGKVSFSDTLGGASTPPLAGVRIPNILPTEKLYKIKVPKNKKAGQECSVTIAGQSFTVKIPPGKKQNDSFEISVPDITNIYASTVHTLPGMVVLMAKPIIFTVVAEAFYVDGGNTSSSDFAEAFYVDGVNSSSVDLNGLAKKLGKLIQQAQSKILQKAATCGCNAVLGISYTVSNDSSGESGLQKVICVMASGTPCIVNTAEDMPFASVQAFPEDNNVARAHVI